jgi:hypothetical protein
MAKMPVLDVSLFGALNAYGRRVLSRIGNKRYLADLVVPM